MRAGKLDRAIIFERVATEIDEAGTPVETWSRLAIRRAEIIRDGATETVEGSGAVSSTVVKFRTRYTPGLTLADRIGFDGRVFDITEIVEIGRRRSLEISAKRVGP